MKIAFLADPLDNQSAGIHVYTREIIKAITHLDAPHEFLIIRAKQGDEDFGNAKQIIVPVKSFPPFHLRIRQLFSIPKILIREKVDVVVEPAHFGPFNLPKHIKRVTVIHDLTPLLFPQFHNQLSYWMHRLLLPSILKKADWIITNSECTRQDVIKQYPYTASKSKAILLGKDTSFVPTKTPSILEKYGISKPYFLYVGTVEPRKNLEVLLKAFEHYKQQTGASDQLVFAGKKGWKMDAFYQKIEQSDYVSDIICTGYFDTADLPTLYSMASCFIYPSFYEGFGLPVLEAMSCGIPVITSQWASLPEVAGDAGLYFDGKNVHDLAQIMIDIRQHPTLAKTKSQAVLERAAQFSWHKTAVATLECIDDLF